MNQKNCRVCLGEHQDEVHAATLRVREWLRERVTRNFEMDRQPEAAPDAA